MTRESCGSSESHQKRHCYRRHWQRKGMVKTAITLQLQCYWRFQLPLMLPATPTPMPLLIPWSSAAKLVRSRMKPPAGKPSTVQVACITSHWLAYNTVSLVCSCRCSLYYQLAIATHTSLSAVCLVRLQMSGSWIVHCSSLQSFTCAVCATAVPIDLAKAAGNQHRQCWAQYAEA